MANDGAYNGHNIVRLLQVLTLIPAWALMAAVVSWYNSHENRTPGSVITLFVATLLASVWAFCILIAALRARNTALWIAFWDIVAMGLLIAGVAVTSDLVNNQCTAAAAVTTTTNTTVVYETADGQRVAGRPALATNTNDNDDDFWDDLNNCNLIKAAWILAIINIVLFFISAILAVVVYRQNEQEAANRVVVEEPIVEKVYTEPVYPERPRRARRSHRSSRSRRDDYY